MPWTNPRTWLTGETISTGNLNAHIRDNLAWLGGSAPRARCAISTTTDQSVANDTNVALIWNNEITDTAAIHDTSVNPSRFTIADTGWYLVGVRAEFAANATGYRRVSLRVGGTTTIADQNEMTITTAAVDCVTSLTMPLFLGGGTYLEAVVRQNSGGALAVRQTSEITLVYLTP